MIELLRRLGYRPISCVWELTLACNLRCQHCGSHAGSCREDELSLDECLRVADELAALGCERVTLSGGEPTMAPHWHEVGRRLTERGVGTNILSNGWGWNDEQLDRARHAGLTNLGFSLDGLERAHDTIRRKGSYGRVIDIVDRAVSEGWRVAVVTHLNSLNLKHLPELCALLADHGVVHWQVQLGTPAGSMGDHEDLLIAPDELLWLLPLLAELRAQHEPALEVRAAHNVGYYGKWETALRDEGTPLDVWVGCRAGCQAIGIESNGTIKGCLSLPSAMHGEDQFVEGSVRQDSLSAIWCRPDAFALNRSFDRSRLGGFCAVCRYGDICRGGCGWTAFSYTSNRFDNPYCFYRQAVLNRRLDLLGDDTPSEQEMAFVQPPGAARR